MADKITHIYTWSNLDGILLCLWPEPRRIINKPHIFMGGHTELSSLTDDQLRAGLQILMKDPSWKGRASFYSGNDWAKSGCPNVRGPVIRKLV